MRSSYAGGHCRWEREVGQPLGRVSWCMGCCHASVVRSCVATLSSCCIGLYHRRLRIAVAADAEPGRGEGSLANAPWRFCGAWGSAGWPSHPRGMVDGRCRVAGVDPRGRSMGRDGVARPAGLHDAAARWTRRVPVAWGPASTAPLSRAARAPPPGPRALLHGVLPPPRRCSRLPSWRTDSRSSFFWYMGFCLHRGVARSCRPGHSDSQASFFWCMEFCSHGAVACRRLGPDRIVAKRPGIAMTRGTPPELKPGVGCGRDRASDLPNGSR